MMANSAKDPYWQAGVRREVMDHPQAQAAIEAQPQAAADVRGGNPKALGRLIGETMRHLGGRGDPQIVRIPPSAIYDAGLELGSHPEVEALFISCTGLRVSSIIAPLEEALGKPVVTSNQALAWQCLRLAGCDDAVEGFGRLMSA